MSITATVNRRAAVLLLCCNLILNHSISQTTEVWIADSSRLLFLEQDTNLNAYTDQERVDIIRHLLYRDIKEDRISPWIGGNKEYPNIRRDTTRYKLSGLRVKDGLKSMLLKRLWLVELLIDEKNALNRRQLWDSVDKEIILDLPIKVRPDVAGSSEHKVSQVFEVYRRWFEQLQSLPIDQIQLRSPIAGTRFKWVY